MDFSDLSTKELWLQMQDDLYDGQKDDVVAEVREALSRGFSPGDVLARGLVAGMDIVGADFRYGILFVPEVLMAANAMKAGMELLRPLLTETGAERIGKMVIGTVKGDIHDIGKNLVAMMMEGAGFEVINLGINNDADKFLGAVREHQPDIVGMSALLTTTMPYMKVVIQALKDEGLRESVFVMVGGAPVTETLPHRAGPDAYGRDAPRAVEIARGHMWARRQQTSSRLV
ncbi:MAG TPA: corrinoid protein [Roseiflexaceae bacterium]|nr:corrinoid protein [Roseiflexaceae bacterium]